MPAMHGMPATPSMPAMPEMHAMPAGAAPPLVSGALPADSPVSMPQQPRADLAPAAAPQHGGWMPDPAALDALPEPRALYQALGKPDVPREPPFDARLVDPYWLAGKNIAAPLECDLNALSLPMPAGVPTQILANVPDTPPRKLPEEPPLKSFFIDKSTAMIGQKAAPSTAPAQPTGMPYWLPSQAGVKHGFEAPEVPAHATAGREAFDVHAVRSDFPILAQRVNGKPLVWLDNAATTQKPRAVLDRMRKFYEEENSNVHRAAHELAARATDAYEAAREKLRRFLGAASIEEIVFTRGTTESINLFAQTWGKQYLEAGDEIILTEYEHHSNIVPWQMIARERGARIRVAPILDSGELDLEAYERLFGNRTRIVSIGHVSNALGTVAPLRQMIATAHRHGAVVLVDGAQSVPHFPVNMQDLDVDFFAMSGHKLFGPTGVGLLYGKRSLLAKMPPWQGGGNMIRQVTFEHTVYADVPAKFEAGTAILAGAVGLGAAVDYLERIGFAVACRHEEALLHYAQERLAALPGIRMIGTAREKAGVLSFVSDRLSPAAIGEALNKEGIAVRVGHHCAQPALAHFGLQETVRPSLAFYNTHEEVDLLVDVVGAAVRGAG
jgi:cysteine desulfurase/selenocysteine lyase